MANSSMPASSASEIIPPAKRLEHRLRALQLSLSAEALRDIALSSPLWAAIMVALFGGILADLGTTSAAQSWPWIALCATVAAAIFFLSRIIRHRAQAEQLNGSCWTAVVIAAYFLVAASWS